MTAAATNVWEVTSERRSTPSTHFRATNFKENLLVVMRKELKCMVSGALGGLSTNPNDSNSIVCAHIIPNRARSKPGVLKKLGYTAPDIDCVRNGLFLAYNIEQAFDKLQLCFVDNPHPLTDGLVMKIYDVCRDVPLYIGSDRVIGEFDGYALTLGDHLPFRSALCYHAYYTFLEVDFGATVDMSQLSSSPERVTYLSHQIRLHLDSIDRSIDTTF
jgi:HNH endonuclease